ADRNISEQVKASSIVKSLAHESGAEREFGDSASCERTPELENRYTARMATRRAKLGPLTPRGREILAYVFNSIAFKSHDQNCDVEALAEHLGMKPGTLRRTLAKMTDAGYVTVE